jgi:hypothetical protein
MLFPTLGLFSENLKIYYLPQESVCFAPSPPTKIEGSRWWWRYKEGGAEGGPGGGGLGGRKKERKEVVIRWRGWRLKQVVVVATAAEEEDVASRTPVEGKALRERKDTKWRRGTEKHEVPAAVEPDRSTSSRIAAEGQGMPRKEMRKQEVMVVEEQEPTAVVDKEALFGKRWWNWWPFRQSLSQGLFPSIVSPR